jgi:trehalose 2-sulfotransferase
VQSPDRAYLVCSTPRSGSTLLCRALEATGVAGEPTEYFNPHHRARLTAQWGCGTDLASYLRALLSRRTGSNGVFGSKLHWDQFVRLRAEALGIRRSEPGFEVSADLLQGLLGSTCYVHLIRSDVDRQAVSLWVAAQSGRWYRTAEESERPPARVPYSFKGIQRCRAHITNGEVHWDRFFRFNGIVPVTVVYEELVADFADTVRRVTAELVPGSDDVAVDGPHIARLAGEQSEELLERFRRDVARRPPVTSRSPRRVLVSRVGKRVRSLRRALP